MVFLNGQFVAEESAVISVFDRGFLYGDGLFETVRILGGQPFRWAQHDERLRRGADFLKMRVPFSSGELSGFVEELIARNGARDSVLRLTLSRGVGAPGYSTRGAGHPTLVMSLHPAPISAPGHPPSTRLVSSSLRVPAGDALAVFKSCNKLPQILARAEAEAVGADEAILLNTRGKVAETAAGNLFWVQAGRVHTPPLATGVLAGVTRAVLLEICAARSAPVQESAIGIEALRKVQGVFVTNSSLGVVEAVELDRQPLRRSPLLAGLQDAYKALVRRECGDV